MAKAQDAHNALQRAQSEAKVRLQASEEELVLITPFEIDHQLEQAQAQMATAQRTATTKSEELLKISKNLDKLTDQMQGLQRIQLTMPNQKEVEKAEATLKESENDHKNFISSKGTDVLTNGDAKSVLAHANDMVKFKQAVDLNRRQVLQAKLAYANAEQAHQDFVDRQKEVAEMKLRLESLVKGVSVELTEAVEEQQAQEREIARLKDARVAGLQNMSSELTQRFNNLGSLTKEQVALAKNHHAAVEAEVQENNAVQLEVDSIRAVAQEQLVRCSD